MIPFCRSDGEEVARTGCSPATLEHEADDNGWRGFFNPMPEEP
jgi:hypothetical protein